jgi:hypothetical protein
LLLQLPHGGAQEIWFEPPSYLLRRCEERDGAGVPRFDLQVVTYRTAPGGLVPADLVIRVPPRRVQVRLAYARPDVNPVLPADLFRLPPVLGAKEVRIGGGEGS